LDIKVISIAYCGTCNYRPIAARLASDIEREIGIRPVLEHSRQIGAFEVSADGKLVFSKMSSRRFPDSDEIIAALRSFREEP
jgi:selT/selW/selH-like putative selenoprotein